MKQLGKNIPWNGKMINMNITMPQYIAYDGKVFEDNAQGARYDNDEFLKVCNDILFIRYRDYDSFDLIPKEQYEDVVNEMAIYHTDDILRACFLMIATPILYCHTKAAADFIEKCLKQKKSKVSGVEQGLLCFMDKDCNYHKLIENDDNKEIICTINNFIKENVE